MSLQWSLPLLISVSNIYVPQGRGWILGPGRARLQLLPGEFHLWLHKSYRGWSNEIGNKTISQLSNKWVILKAYKMMMIRSKCCASSPSPAIFQERSSSLSQWEAQHQEKGQCWLHKCHPYVLPMPANSTNPLGVALAQHAKPRYNAANCISPLVPLLWKGKMWAGASHNADNP